MLGRAQDLRANGAWLNTLTRIKHEVFVLGGQRIDQKIMGEWSEKK